MDGRRPSGDRASDPGELLRSVLEKIVFFECKVAQLESELAAARQIAERARADAAQSRSRETELSQELATARSDQGAFTLRETDLVERIALLEAERERLMGGLVERARLGGAPAMEGDEPADADESDLAGFIAELRAEIESLRGWKAAAEALGVATFDAASAPAPTPTAPRTAAGPAALAELAGGFRAAGRTGLSRADAGAMAAMLPARADRVLYERAMADLSASETAVRKRAIRQLAALGARASAPLLASALGREADAGVKVTLLEALGRFQEPFAAELAVRELSDPRAEVRAAALEMLAAVAHEQAQPHLARGLGDQSPIVRRRAAVLLGFARGELAEAALAGALRDANPGVARAAAAALSGRASETTRRALEKYQRGASRPAVTLAPPPVAARPRVAAPVSVAAPAASAPRARTAVAVLESPAPAVPPPGGGALEAAVLLELRGALRGRTAEELVRVCDAPAARIDAALELLAGRGSVARRGPRWCMA
jgi:HEAT repeats